MSCDGICVTWRSFPMQTNASASARCRVCKQPHWPLNDLQSLPLPASDSGNLAAANTIVHILLKMEYKLKMLFSVHIVT